MIDANMVQKIANTFSNSEEVALWINQKLIQFEQEQAEQAIELALQKNDIQLFRQAYDMLKNKQLAIDPLMVERISKTQENPQKKANVINSALSRIDPEQAVINELYRGSEANVDNLDQALSQCTDLNKEYGFNQLSIGEQSIPFAYNNNNVQLFRVIYELLEQKNFFNDNTIQRISSTYENSQSTINWINANITIINNGRIKENYKKNISDDGDINSNLSDLKYN